MANSFNLMDEPMSPKGPLRFKLKQDNQGLGGLSRLVIKIPRNPF